MTAAIGTMTGAVTSGTTNAPGRATVKLLLHAEGAAAFVAGIVLYLNGGGDAWLFLPVLLLPDISLFGYLAGPRIGAVAYDLVHNWAVGLAVLGIGAATGLAPLWLAGAVLIAHVGIDRAVGYGLKYATSPKTTHLQRI